VGLACVGLACVGLACVGLACVGLACVGLACVGLACVGLACVGLACVGRTLFSASLSILGESFRGLPLDPLGCVFNSRLLAGKARPEPADGSTRSTPSKSKTMCFPTRRTATIRLRSRVAAMSSAGDFSGSGLSPSQTDSITSPETLADNPRAMVSTSGSSGMHFQFTRASMRSAVRA
jgi:hypothetical protein